MRGGCSGGVVTNVTRLHDVCKVSTAASLSDGEDGAFSTKEAGQKLQEKQSLHAVPR